MNRSHQREIGALKVVTDRFRKEHLSTLTETIWLPADTLDYLVAAGGDVFRDYPAKVRRRMATEGSALPDGSFPIANCSDASDAIRSIGRAGKDKRAAAEAHIRKRVRALRCQGTLYDNWR